MLEKLTHSDQNCPICGSATLEPHDKEFIVCLRGCVVRTRHNYDGAQYGQDYARNYIEYAKSPVNTPLNLFRLGLIARWVQKHNTILDIGCCVGEFLSFAEKYFPFCAGFEPNKIAAKIAEERVPASPIWTDLDGHIRPFCITMFDVIEHIENPKEFLQHLHNIMQSSGIVAITTPDFAAVGLKFDTARGEYETNLRSWKHYKPTEHLWLHTVSSLDRLLHDTGFKPIYWGEEESHIRPGNPNGDILTCVARRIDG